MGGGPRGNRGIYSSSGGGGGSIVSTGDGEQRTLMYQVHRARFVVRDNIKYTPNETQTILQDKLQSDSGAIVIDAIGPTIAVAHPIFGVIYVLYKIAQILYPIVKAGVLTYERTRDAEKTAAAVIKEGIKQMIIQAASAIATRVTDKVMTAATNQLGIKIGDKTYQVIENAVSTVVT